MLSNHQLYTRVLTREYRTKIKVSLCHRVIESGTIGILFTNVKLKITTFLN